MTFEGVLDDCAKHGNGMIYVAAAPRMGKTHRLCRAIRYWKGPVLGIDTAEAMHYFDLPPTKRYTRTIPDDWIESGGRRPASLPRGSLVVIDEIDAFLLTHKGAADALQLLMNERHPWGITVLVSSRRPAETPKWVTDLPDWYVVGQAQAGVSAEYWERFQPGISRYLPDLKQGEFLIFPR